MITEVVLSPIGLGWEAVGIHPRNKNWVLNGYGPTGDDALRDYQNRYRQEKYMGLYDPYAQEAPEIVQIVVADPEWLAPEPEDDL